MTTDREDLMQRDECYHSIIQTAMDGFWRVDLQGRLLEVNDAYCRMSGYSAAELLTMVISDLKVADDPDDTAAHLKRIVQQGQDRFESRHRRRDGTVFDIEASVQYRDLNGGEFIGFIHDISERKRAEARLLHVTRLYALLSQVNQAIVRSRGQEELFRAICQVAIDFGQFRMAWIGLVDEAGIVIPAAHAGQVDGYLDRIQLSAGDNPTGSGPTGLALREQVVVTCRDIATDPLMLPWRDEALARGYLSSAAVPLSRKGKSIGALNLYAAETGFFTGEERRLLQEIGDDISFALDAMDSGSERTQAELALQQEQSLYEDLVNTMPAGAYRLRVKHRGDWRAETWRALMEAQYSVDMASDRFCAILGLSREAFMANPGTVPDLIHPHDQESFNSKNVQAMTEFTPFVWEGRILRHGETRWVHFESVPRVMDPETVLWTGIVSDITSRKDAEKEHLANEERMALAMQAGNMGLYDLNVKTGEAVVNPEYALMLGYEPAEFHETNAEWIERLHPDDREPVAAVYRAYVAGELPQYKVEFRQKTREGTWKWILSLGRIMERDANGDPQRMLGVHVDISERKQAEEALRENENRLRFALEGTNDGLWDVQMESRQTYLSPRGWEILGYGAEETEGHTPVWSDLVHPKDLPHSIERMQAHLDGLTPIFEVEQRLRMKSGQWKWILSRGKVVSRDQEGKPLRMTGTHTDITEQKKLQDQLLQAQKMEAIGRLAGGVAHDFNNMLMVIHGYAEMALAQVQVGDPLQTMFKEIQKAADRSADLTRQLLAFARKQTASPRVIALNETIDNMLTMMRRLIGEDIRLAWHPDRAIWPVKMDPIQVDQILANLCINARDAISGVGSITIETKNIALNESYCSDHRGFVPGEYALLVVSDDGAGMDKETLDRIFEPFFTTKGVGQGTGLGLATVYGIVKQNNGFIEARSEPGHGTSFRIYLPRHLGKEEQLRAAGPVEPVMRGQETVLLVEDEPAILDLGKQMLEMQGYRVLVAGTPGEAIQLAQEHVGEIHLLVTDVVMPEMNGRELAKSLLSLYPGLKRLFMSGYSVDIIAHHGVLDEGVQFIQKPFSFNDLAVKVREVLDQ